MLKNKLLSAMGGAPANYIEDVFSTYLYTGNGNTAPETQTINNGIDLSGKGGLVWIKNRSTATNNVLFDTARGATKVLVSNATSAESTDASTLTSFNNNGFSVYYGQGVNGQNNGLASWTFRKQPKFFDVVTFTSGAGTQTINHNLGSTPGMIVVKRTTGTSDWWVWHRSIPNNALALNTTQSTSTFTNPEYIFGDGSTVVQPTGTQFTFYAPSSGSNTYVAYLFAHDAGGFGLTGTDNVISCGSFDATSAGSVELGYEPQWVLIKASNDVGSWHIQDNMRGYTTSGNNPTLDPDRSVAEFSGGYTNPTATGFKYGGMGSSFIYIAIRRGPMKVPTSGTSVFAPVLATTPSSPYTATTNFPVDLLISSATVASGKDAMDRLRGGTTTSFRTLFTNTTGAESVGTGYGIGFQSNTSIIDNAYWSGNGVNIIYWNFRRAPSFFDVVCYTGTGNNPLVLNHNLGVAPTVIIIKRRSSAASNNNWYCGWNMNASTYMEAILNTSDAGTSYSYPNWFVSAPTSTTFDLNGGGNVNQSGATYVAYLFATCAGVSKVGSYTGTGTTLQIDCGFTGGARFVLIKRTDSTGDWYVWDSARGIVSGNDPYLLLNSTAAEVTNTDYVDTYSAGFEISSTAPAAINASGGTYIFLAIA